MLAFSSPACPSPYAPCSLLCLVSRATLGVGRGGHQAAFWGAWAMLPAVAVRALRRRQGKDEVCRALALWLLLSCVDLIVSGRVVIKMATAVTPVTPSAALVLFPTDSEDQERGNDSGTPLPTSDNGDNSLGYTGRVHLSKIFLTASS